MFQWTNLVIISLTQKCNMNCAYCFLGDKTNLPSTQMSLKTFKQIIDKIVSDCYKFHSNLSEKSPIQLLLHGGEPTLLPSQQIDEMLSYGERELSQKNIPYQFMIQTNGIKLSREYRNVLSRHNVQIGVSIDGLTNNLRESSVDPKILIQNIEDGLNEGIPIRTLSVATKYNIKNLVENINVLPHHNVLKIVAEEDCGPNVDLSPSPEDEFKYLYLRNFENFIDLSNKKIFLHESMRIMYRYLIDRLTYHSVMCKSTCNFKDCGSGTQLISIMPDGMVRLCDRFRGDEDFIEPRICHVADFNFLNLKQLQKNLEWICLNNERHKERGCDWCIYRYTCLIPCACASYKKNGRPFISEDTCKLTKLIWNWLDSHLDEILEAIIVRCNGLIDYKEDVIYSLKPSAYLPGNYQFILKSPTQLEVCKKIKKS